MIRSTHTARFKALVMGSALFCSLMGCSATTTTGDPDATETKTAGGSGKATSGSVWQGSKSGAGVDLVKIPVKFRKAGRALSMVASDYFGLALATTYSMTINGCQTGYTATATEQSGGVLSLILNDKDCLAKLTQFSIGADEYIPDPDAPADKKFDTFIAGDTAIFVNSDTGNKLQLRVVHQISATVDHTNDTVEYTYSDIKVAADTTEVSEYSDGIAITVASQDAPEYTIAEANFEGLTAGAGGKFSFVLECPATIADGKCSQQDIVGTRYILIEHGSACNTITSEAAVSMFEDATPSTPVAVEIGDVLASTVDPVFKGGFTTKTDANVLVGPDQMYLHRDLQFLLQSTASDGGGIRCFNVHVAAIDQD